MWVQIRRIKIVFNAVVCIVMCQILTACTDCEDYISRSVTSRYGAVKIDTIYLEWGDRAYTVANKITGDKLLYYDDDFPLKAHIGDSLVKQKGEAEYTLYTKDSVYVQRFDCSKKRGIIVSREVRR